MTKIKSDQLRRGAGELLSHFIPRDVLREAHELAHSFQHEEAFRDYVMGRIWLVIPVAFVFVLVSTICAVGAMLFLLRSAAPPVALWLRGTVLLLGAGIWLGGIVTQLYVFFAWLETRALDRHRPAPPRAPSASRARPAPAKPNRSWIPWLFVALFVGVPVGLLAVHSPVVAIVLIGAGILAPTVYKHFDR